jgi:threonine dehydrogenase-like Zn-dependent dehydrogenase
MLGVHFLGDKEVLLHQVPRPRPAGRKVVVRVQAAAICGTDRENLEGAGQETIPGHENAGQVVAVDKPTWIEVGDRVAINCHVTCGGCKHCLRGDLYFCDDLCVIGFDRDGGFAEFVRVPEACCMPIPDDVSFEAGALLVDMVGTPFRAAKRAHLLPDDRIAIWGAGPIGLGELMVTSWLGARAAVIDLSDYRLAMAEDLGADLTLNPTGDDVAETLAAWTGGEGIDAAFDCVGKQVVAEQAIAALRERGTLVIVGVSHELVLNPWKDLIQRELTVLGTRNFNAAAFGEMIALVQRGLPVERAVTHRFALAEAEEAFERFLSGECGKVLLVP